MTVSTKQSRVQHYVTTGNATTFSAQFAKANLLESVTPDKSRNRLFPVDVTLSLFMAQAMKSDRSCQGVVIDLAATRLSVGLLVCSTKTGAYCRARARLSVDLVSCLVKKTGTLNAASAESGWRWMNRPVNLIDGTTVTLPDTQANQAAYPKQINQKEGLGFPICRILGVICLASGAIINAAMGPFQGKGSG